MSSEPLDQVYKRDQVERAIARVTGRIASARFDPDPGLKTDLRRLLDVDRMLENPEPGIPPFAFLDHAPPGQRGVDQVYSAQGAFALLSAERLLKAGVPQRRAVILIRRIRRELDEELQNIWTADLEALAPSMPEGERRARIINGTLVCDAEHMRFLVTSGGSAAGVFYSRSSGAEIEVGNFCRGHDKLLSRLEYLARMKNAVIVLELANIGLQLVTALGQVETRRRGRS